MCDCLDQCNDRLGEAHNVRVCAMRPVVACNIEPPKVLLKTEKADGKGGRSRNVVAVYCPFCGTKYDD